MYKFIKRKGFDFEVTWYMYIYTGSKSTVPDEKGKKKRAIKTQFFKLKKIWWLDQNGANVCEQHHCLKQRI